MPPKRKSSISRGAVGLPRYYMDCGWYRHPNFAGLGLDSLALFEAMIGYSCEHATDGRLPGHHEDLAAALGLRSSAVKKALKPLLDRGRIVLEGDHHEVVGFSSHNPTADEIDAYIEERSTSGSKGNHIRHHVNKGRWSAECEHCPDTEPTRSSDPNSDRSSDPTAVADRSHGLGGVGLGVPPQSPAAKRTPVAPDVAGAGTPTEDDQPPTPDTLAEAVIDHMARCDLDQTTEIVRQPDRWLNTARKNRRAQHLDQIHQTIAATTTTDPATIAERIDPTCGPLDGGTARADHHWHQAQAQLEADRQADEADRQLQARIDQALDELDVDALAELNKRATTEAGTDHPALVRRAARSIVAKELAPR